MPFTLAHPAAVVPIWRAFRQRVSLSALLAGSVAPDFRHFPQLPSFGIPSHSIPGMFTFCLPLGLLFYASFHGVFKRPLIALLPDGWASRVESLEASHRRWPRASVATVVVSLLAGTATHLTWDSFTHKEPVADHIPVLHHLLFGAPVYELLQYACSVLGMGLLAWWLERWYRETPPRPARPTLAPGHRVVAIASILAVSAVIAVAAGAAVAADAGSGLPRKKILFAAAFGGLCGLWLVLLAFSAWWYRLRSTAVDLDSSP